MRHKQPGKKDCKQMAVALVIVPLAAIAGSAMHLMLAGSVGGGMQAELSATLLSLLLVVPLFAGWLESE